MKELIEKIKALPDDTVISYLYPARDRMPEHLSIADLKSLADAHAALLEKAKGLFSGAVRPGDGLCYVSTMAMNELREAIRAAGGGE